MSIEKALKDHTAALNRFCNLCEKHGINLTAPQVAELAQQVEQPTETVSAQDTAPVETVEPTATAPVTQEPEAENIISDGVENLVWVDDTGTEINDDSDVAEAPAVETLAKVTVNDVANSMKKLLPNRNAIVAVLDQFGVGKVTELKAEDLAKAKQLFDQALQEV